MYTTPPTMRMAMLMTFTLLLTVCSIVQIVAQEGYAVVVDAGSTGTRTFILHFSLDGNRKPVAIQTKGKKIKPGLSSYVANPADAIARFLDLFIDAATHIPKEFHSTTSVHIRGTAGMRLLEDKEQNNIWHTLHEGLSTSSNFSFSVDLKNMGTIDGESEAYFGAIAANFIEGSIDASLVPIAGKEMIGALDMGGSSTQLIHYVGTRSPDVPVTPDDFWSHSWLNFGVEAVREKVWSNLVQSHLKSRRERQADAGVGIDESEPQDIEPAAISNPCTFPGHELLVEDGEGKGLVLVGSGRGDLCVELIRDVMWPRDEDEHCEAASQERGAKGPCPIEGVEHPPLTGHFYAMSVYYYAIDCIRMLGSESLPHWPNPSIDEIEAASHSFCSIPWTTIDTTRRDTHPYTGNSQLAHRCLEGLYLVTLMEHAFGFDGTARDITLALDVKGSEVEWSLGYALTEILPTVLNAESPSSSSSCPATVAEVDAVAPSAGNALSGHIARLFAGVRRALVAIKEYFSALRAVWAKRF